MSKFAPGLSGDPIILVHLAGPDGNTACSGDPFVPGYGYEKIPKVLCPACAKAWPE